MDTLIGRRAVVFTLPDFLLHFCSACLSSRCSYNNRFRLVAAGAYSGVEFDGDDEAVSFASFGDLCNAVMPDTWVFIDWKAKKQAMRNDFIRSWLVDC